MGISLIQTLPDFKCVQSTAETAAGAAVSGLCFWMFGELCGLSKDWWEPFEELECVKLPGKDSWRRPWLPAAEFCQLSSIRGVGLELLFQLTPGWVQPGAQLPEHCRQIKQHGSGWGLYWDQPVCSAAGWCAVWSPAVAGAAIPAGHRGLDWKRATERGYSSAGLGLQGEPGASYVGWLGEMVLELLEDWCHHVKDLWVDWNPVSEVGDLQHNSSWRPVTSEVLRCSVMGAILLKIW